jgi:hypothetical protein
MDPELLLALAAILALRTRALGARAP